MAEKGFMTVREVAEYLRVSEMMIYRLCERGELAHIKVGRSIRVSREDLEEYIRKQRQRSKEE